MTQSQEICQTVKTWPAMRIEVGSLACTVLPRGDRFQLPSSDYLRVLLQAKSETDVPELITQIRQNSGRTESEAREIIEDLLRVGLLVPAETEVPELAAMEHWVKRGWLDALLLHCTTRDLSFRDSESVNPVAVGRSVLRSFIAADGLPELWNDYPTHEALELPEPATLPDEPLEAVLLRRRSNRPWHQTTLDPAQLSSILLLANQETLRLRRTVEDQVDSEPGVLLNSSFTALETYLLCFRVGGVEPGLFHYDLRSHRLISLKPGQHMDEYVRMCIGQERVRGAACAVVITAKWQRFMYRYRHPRAYRTLLINVAELAHKYLLLATAFGLSTFMTPAFADEVADALVGVDGMTEGILYTVAFG